MVYLLCVILTEEEFVRSHLVTTEGCIEFVTSLRELSLRHPNVSDLVLPSVALQIFCATVSLDVLGMSQ